MIDLSVLVCGVHTRYDTFLPRIQKQLFEQYATLPAKVQRRIEILVLVDNKKQTLGGKRNQMVGLAQGTYLVFVDDDDRVADDYLLSLYLATRSGADCIVFDAEVTIDGSPPVPCHFSKDYGSNRDEPDGYRRIPNHISCVKRALAVQVPFKPEPYNEDTGYATGLLPLLKTEHRIDRVLYYYDYNSAVSEPQEARPH